jgi:hypothetical protein
MAPIFLSLSFLVIILLPYIYICVCVCVSKLILSGYSSRSKGRDDNIESELIYTEDSGAGRDERL